ncbi:trans-1,2-dihydrobenzene-1,2-diol dehydrogenase-like [Tubulanus polymorphus]|uniref:trans-1,2-dihydrobenzene-1,2-diol dehydrogenase-like n=1 Tax=Tubulanus polymorphus TaxID=672921 RepID=UPI003DA51199
MAPLRWGLAGAGAIAHDFVSAIELHAPDEKKLMVQAVAARDLQRAKTFAENHGIAQAYGCYQEIADDPNIDIIYVNNITNHHYEVCMQMLKAGKHVLCEKPLTMDIEQTKEILAYAKQQKKFLMEAVWSRFTPGYEQLRAELSRNAIGDVRLVDAKFSVNIEHVPRTYEPNLGASVIFDLGIYTIQLATMVLGNKCKKIHCAGTLFPTGIENMSNITLIYDDKTIARLFCCASQNTENSAQIYGTKGKLEFQSTMWSPTELVTPSGFHQFHIPESEHQFNFVNSANLYYEFKAVNEAIQKGLLEHPLMTHEDTLSLVEIATECIKQIKSAA